MDATDGSEINNSGDPSITVYPPQLNRWNWSAFLWGGIWSIGHRSWLGLLIFLPYVGIVFAIWQGAQGYKWAWKNNRYESVEALFEQQRMWLRVWFWCIGGLFVVGVVSALVIPWVLRH